MSLAADWGAGLGDVAAALVDLPGEACAARDLPSRDALRNIVESLRIALFCKQLGPSGLDTDGRRAFVHSSLQEALSSLAREVAREPDPGSCSPRDDAGGQTPAADRVLAFASTLPEIRRLLRTDLAAALDGDPAARSTTEVLLCYPGFAAVLYHRLAHSLHVLGARLVARMIADIAHSDSGIDIHPGVVVGERFFIDHGTGVVIGETTIIGAGVRLYQGVTLGARSFPVDAAGQIIRGAPRHPILEDDVIIYAGATILGRVVVGEGSVIGGGVWLTRGVPAHSQILQAAVRADSFADGAGI